MVENKDLNDIMTTNKINVPVLFLIFNRPDTTRQVFDEIRKAQPDRLFVAADGPRKDRPADYDLCTRTREIIQQVDWECNVSTLFREENLGCKRAISSAIDWFFTQVEEGIILEDDCVPDQSFFPYCQELLERYRNDERVMMISGDNFQSVHDRTEGSYYFSRYVHIWGWATWKRAWKYYDVEMKVWPEIREKGYLSDILSETRAVKYWRSIFDAVYQGEVNTWDYQWVFSCWIQGGLSIMPSRNLVSNIGFDENSTHTKGETVFSRLPVKSIQFPLVHPNYVIRDSIADRQTEKIWFSSSVQGVIRSKFTLGLNKIRKIYS